MVIALLLAGCAPEAPAEPTWAEHVKPIVEARCLRCHGETPIGGAPPGLRLDVYQDTVAPDGVEIGGAAQLICFYARPDASDNYIASGFMPPIDPLEDWQKDVLLRWCESFPEAPARGRRPDNHPPELAITEQSRDATTVTLAYEVSDADRESVYGELRGAVAAPPLATLHAGRGQLVVSLAALPLEVVLDDGSDVVVIPLTLDGGR